MRTIIYTDNNEVVVIDERWTLVPANSGLYKEEWTECPTLIDKDGNLWVDESALKSLR